VGSEGVDWNGDRVVWVLDTCVRGIWNGLQVVDSLQGMSGWTFSRSVLGFFECGAPIRGLVVESGASWL
jgi:hypothetical protein